MTEYTLIVGTEPYADIAARNADTIFHSNPKNVNKVVRVDSPLTFYILTDNAPTFDPVSAATVNQWTLLSDTPGAILEGQVVQGGAGGTALEFGQALGPTNIPTFAGLALESPGADTVAFQTLQSAGANGGVAKTRVGDRDPTGIVDGDAGDEYRRSNAELSGTFENRGGSNPNTDWMKRSVNPSSIVEVNSVADFEELAVASVITINADLIFEIKVPIVTSVSIVVASAAQLILSGVSREIGITYIGSGDFISGTGSVDIHNVALINGATSNFIDLTLDSPNSVVLIDNVSLIGWSSLGSFTNGNVFISATAFISVGAGFTFTNTVALGVFRSSLLGVPFGTTLFTVDSNINRTLGDFADLNVIALTSAGSVLDLAGTSNHDARFIISTVNVVAGDLFRQSVLTDADFTAVADGTIGDGSITAQADNGSGGTTHSSATVYFNGELVEITGTSFYDGEFTIFNVVAGVSFDTVTAFVSNEATGVVATERLTVTLDGGHGIGSGDSLKIINSNFYNSFYTALNVVTNTLTINGNFVGTGTGAIEHDLSLDQSDVRVLASNNPGFTDSKYLACGFVNDNMTANGAIVNGVFTDIIFGTVGDAMIASSTMERWRLVDEINSTFEYFGHEPFDGLITYDFTVESSGGAVDFRFKWERSVDGGSSFSDLADPVVALVTVGSDAQSISKTFSLIVNEGDQIRPQVTRDSGTSGITTTFATVYAAQ